MIKTNNSRDPLVDVTKYCPSIINGFDPLRLRYGKNIYLREGVAKMLANAQSYLPEGVTFIILDAWRPKEAQLKFYDYYYKKFESNNPNWSKQKVAETAGKYAIAPDKLFRAGHLTGGAIDLELWKNGKRLPIMARKIPFTEAVKTSSANLPANVKATRNMLADAMTKAGFANYPEEYWHWCYGDYMWAEITKNNSTIYGLTKP